MRIKLPSNDVNREQPAFLIFPMFVILTWLSANIHQNYVKNIQFTELFPMHTLQWSTILPEMLLQQIHSHMCLGVRPGLVNQQKSLPFSDAHGSFVFILWW